MRKYIPFVVFFGLLLLLGRELFYAKPNELPSPLIGEDIPSFRLPTLYNDQQHLTPANLTGRVALLNVWATWCYACQLEQAMLLKISHEYRVPIYGIDYEDNKEAAKQWLAENGDPFVLIGDDKTGDVAIDLGVYGTPETFVISPQGKIIYRHVGIIDQKAWDDVLYPLIKKYGA